MCKAKVCVRIFFIINILSCEHSCLWKRTCCKKNHHTLFLHPRGPIFFMVPCFTYHLWFLACVWNGGCQKRGIKGGRGEGILVGLRHRKRIYEKRKKKKEENSYTIPSFQKWKDDQVFQGTLNKERINPFINTVTIKLPYSPGCGPRWVSPAKPLCSPSAGGPKWGSSTSPPRSQSGPVRQQSQCKIRLCIC